MTSVIYEITREQMDGRSPGILWADWISLRQDIHSRFDGLDLSDEKPQRLSLQGENGPGWHWLRVKLQREAWAQVRGVRLKPFLSNKGGLKLRRMDGAAVDVREAGCGEVSRFTLHRHADDKRSECWLLMVEKCYGRMTWRSSKKVVLFSCRFPFSALY